MLVSLRDVELHVSSLESLPGELQIEVRRLLDGGNNWQYAFTVRHASVLLASGRAAILSARAL